MLIGVIERTNEDERSLGYARVLEKTLSVNQLDALTFAKCLEEFAGEIRGAAETYE